MDLQNYTAAEDAKKKQIIKIIYTTFLSAIVLFSYFNLSPSYSGYFNSDTAVQILQADDFHIPADLYYWGQARQGSFVPLMGFIVHKTTGLPAVHAISIVNYSILLALFLIFSSFIQNRLLKIALAFVIFLPAVKFQNILLLGHPYAAQLLFIGIVYVVINKIKAIEINSEHNFKYVCRLLLASIIASFLSIWLSDYSLVFLAYIYLTLAVSRYKNFFALELKNKIILFLLILLSTSMGAAFILYAKYTAGGPAYGENQPIFIKLDFLPVAINHFSSVAKKYIFNIDHPFYSSIVILVSIALFFLVKKTYKDSKDFFILFVLGLFPTVILNWVNISEWQTRFFTPAYFFLWAALLVSIDKRNFKTPFIAVGIALLVFLQSFSIIHFELTNPSEWEKLQSFRKLGNCGLIGDYWASHNIAAANIDSIVATSFPDECRTFKFADEVLRKKNIYLITRLRNFPDTIDLFDVTLIKINNTEQEIEGYKLTKYRLLNPGKKQNSLRR